MLKLFISLVGYFAVWRTWKVNFEDLICGDIVRRKLQVTDIVVFVSTIMKSSLIGHEPVARFSYLDEPADHRTQLFSK